MASPSLLTGCCLLTVTEKQSYVISLMAPPPALTQQQETGDMQTYKSATGWGGGKPFWYHFHHLLSKTNPPLVLVGASVGSFQAEHHNGIPHLELCLWLAWSEMAPISQFTEKRQADRRDSTGNLHTPSNSMLLQLHTIWITSQTLSIQ